MQTEERIKEIFGQAMEMESPSKREHFLTAACAGDPELRRRVETLLEAHEEAGDFLRPTIQVTGSDLSLEPTGAMIGRYKILEKIGEGGFGSVYMAEQTEPVQRKVALKIIKAGMDTREVVARFEAERQALALMDHPNIARVLDAGATQAGRPFFVMELVRGIPITEFCDLKSLPTRERIELFIKVCHAVQHAHQKGIIHRDIKPSNVLVTLHDGVPVPKVIDFGVAKALGQKLTEKTLFTGFAHMIGTPAYMSPEQAELSGLDIDTRADIYSLGVLLYELLTSETPFDKETLAKAALDEIRRMIRESDPPKPSTRLQTLGAKITGIAKQRHTEPATLSRLVRGDLDWITMRCLEKDRSRRYETATNLADDLRRHLQSEPVTAAAPTAFYQFQKFARRNKAALATVGVIAALLAAGVGVSTSEAVRATRAEHVQRELRQQADIARNRAEALTRTNRRLAEESRERLRHLAVANGWRLFEANDALGALVWFAEALTCAHGNATEADQRLQLASVLRESPQLIHADFHDEPVAFAELSPDGRFVVSVSRDLNNSSTRIGDLTTGQTHELPLPYVDHVLKARLSPDSRRLLTVTRSGQAQIWEAVSGRLLSGPFRFGRPADISVDGVLVVTTSSLAKADPGTARVWSTVTGEQLLPSLRHDSDCAPKFSPDGHLLLTISSNAVRICEAATGVPAGPPLQHSKDLIGAEFNLSGSRIATLCSDGTARVWNTRSGALVTAPINTGLRPTIGRRVFTLSPDGKLLVLSGFVSVAEGGDVLTRSWDTETGAEVGPPLRHADFVTELAFSPDARYLLSASADGIAQIWDRQSRKPVGPPFHHAGPVHYAAFDTEGRRALTAGADHAIRVWELPTAARALPPWPEPGVRILAASHAGSRVITQARLGTARVWNTQTWEPVSAPLPITNQVHTAVLSSDGGRLLAVHVAANTGDQAGTSVFQTWEVATGRLLFNTAVPTSRLGFSEGSFATSPDCRQVALVIPAPAKTYPTNGRTRIEQRFGGQLQVWDVTKSERLKPHFTGEETSAGPWQVFKRPAQAPIATLVSKGQVHVFDAVSGERLFAPLPLPRLTTALTHVAFTAEGRSLVVCFSSPGMRFGEAQILEATTGKSIGPPLEHRDGVTFAAFSPDGLRVVTASRDHTARIWDARTGQPVTPAMAHDRWVAFASFSYDGRRVVTASQDATARVWDAASGEPLTPPLLHDGPVHSAEFLADGSYLLTTRLGKTDLLRLPADIRPVEDLLTLSCLTAGRQLDITGIFNPLDRKMVSNALVMLRSKYPRSFTPRVADNFTWHDHEAVSCERTKSWFGAAFHIDRMLAAKPDEPGLRDRRIRVQTELDKTGTAKPAGQK